MENKLNRLIVSINVIFLSTATIFLLICAICTIIQTKTFNNYCTEQVQIEEQIIEPKIKLSDTFEIAYKEMICALGMSDVDSIIYAQALLESNRFTNPRSWDTWNFLGIIKEGRLYQFDSWIEGLVYYKRNIYDRWDKQSDYYEFLEKLGYAVDPNYIKKLKSIK